MNALQSRISQIIVPLALAATLAIAVSWSYPSHSKVDDVRDPSESPSGFTARGCEELKQERDRLRADTRLQGSAVAKELAKLDVASDGEFPRAICSAVKEIAAQQSAMEERQIQMDDAMLEHVMKHIRLGEDSVGACPLMRRIELVRKSSLESRSTAK